MHGTRTRIGVHEARAPRSEHLRKERPIYNFDALTNRIDAARLEQVLGTRARVPQRLVRLIHESNAGLRIPALPLREMVRASYGVYAIACVS